MSHKIQELKEALTTLENDAVVLHMRINAERFMPQKKQLQQQKSEVETKIFNLRDACEKEQVRINREQREQKLTAFFDQHMISVKTSRDEPVNVKSAVEVEVPSAYGFTVKINLADVLTDFQVDRLLVRGEDVQVAINDYPQRVAEIKKLQMTPLKNEEQKRRLYSLREDMKTQSLLTIHKLK